MFIELTTHLFFGLGICRVTHLHAFSSQNDVLPFFPHKQEIKNELRFMHLKIALLVCSIFRYPAILSLKFVYFDITRKDIPGAELNHVSHFKAYFGVHHVECPRFKRN